MTDIYEHANTLKLIVEKLSIENAKPRANFSVNADLIKKLKELCKEMANTKPANVIQKPVEQPTEDEKPNVIDE